MSRSLTLLVLAATFGFRADAAAQSAQAGIDILVEAEAPIACAVSLEPTFVALSADRFAVGRLDRTCNTPHDVYIAAGALSAGGRLVLDGLEVTLSGAVPARIGSTPVYSWASTIELRGMTEPDARRVAASLNVSVTPRPA